MSTPAYVDLMFAWAHARLGDPATARTLAEDATLRLSTGDAAHCWLAAAFDHRIRQAERGESPIGEWPASLLRDYDSADDQPGNLPGRRYIIDVFRLRSRMLEPDFRTDPYTPWKRYVSSFDCQLGELATTTDPLQFDGRFRTLMAIAIEPRDRLGLIEVAARCGRRAAAEVATAVNREGLGLVDEFLRRPPEVKHVSDRFRALVTALRDLALGRQDAGFLGQLVLRLADWVRRGRPAAGRPAAAILFGELVGRLYELDLASDAGLLLDLATEAGDTLRLAGSDPDDLPALVRLGGDERWLHRGGRGQGVFEQARSCLFGADSSQIKPAVVVRLAEAYAQALARGPVAEFGRDLLDLFARLPRVPNGFTTATHYSRLHLALAEAAVLAVTTDDFRPARDLYARLGDEESAARRDLLPALRERIRAWGGPDW